MPRVLPPPAGGQDERDIFDNGLLRVEHDNYYVSLDGRPLKLTRKEFLIISRLARNFDRIVPSEEIWRYAWGDGHPFNTVSMHVHIYRLRRLLESAGLRIDTMVSVGYRLADARGAREAAK
ncbi:MAG TPA: winged helix-turn-helix domain-containing protein [Pyrinomonadaceae bacterium]|nr:winged helix-turn-helix domain-containing protein [Pyrinomonadaceae bacterium]